MTIRTLNPLALEPQAARAYLLCMAEALSKSVAPVVQGESAIRVAECVSLMLRMAEEIAPAENVMAALRALNGAASFLTCEKSWLKCQYIYPM